MHFNEHPVGHVIGWHLHEFHTVTDIGVVRLNNQVSIGIFTARSTYSIYKCLVVGLLHRIVLGSWFSIDILHVNFIGSGKQQMFVVIAELHRYLCPESSLLLVYLFLLSVSRIGFKPATVPMDVQNSVHIIRYTIVNHLFDTSQPGGFDGIVRWIFNVTVPRTRYANGIETGSLHCFDQRLGGLLISPTGFTATSERHLQGVAQVPS